MMKCMHEWAKAHGLLYQPTLPLLAEPPEDESDDYNDADDWCETCDNLGVVNCFCGGDLCVCRNNGEKECPDCGGL